MMHGISCLPLVLGVSLPLSFVITYSIAVYNDHVYPVFPLISDTGTLPTESCVFGQLLNMNAALCLLIQYLRYRQVLSFHRDHGRCATLVKINKITWIIGILIPLGISIVGNFQTTNARVVHLIGGGLAFLPGLIYCVLQVVISYRAAGCDEKEPGNTPCLRRIRVALCAIYAISLLLFVISFPVSRLLGPGPGVSTLKWTPKDPGYPEHVVAAVSEWFAAIITAIFIGTFYSEFKHFRMTSPDAKYTVNRLPLSPG